MSPVREEQSQAAISTQGERRPSSRMVNFGGNLLRIEHRCVHHQILELSAIETVERTSTRARCQLSRHLRYLRHVGFGAS